MFMQNKYTRWYFGIVQKALASDRKKSSTDYFERHHVIPKSLGGSNERDNLVLLTAREHFICHWLLTKMVGSVHRYKMACAFLRMTNSNHLQKRERRARQYEIARLTLSKSMIGRKHSDETKAKIGAIHAGKVVSDEAKAKIAVAMKNRTYSDETIAKMSKAAALRTHSDETKAKISKAKTGVKLPSQNKSYSFVDPTGTVVTTNNLRQFCSDNELQYKTMVCIHTGSHRSKSHKGWSAIPR